MSRQGRLAARGDDARDERVAQVLLECAPERMEGRRALVIDDGGGATLVAELEARGAQVSCWSRMAVGEVAGRVWPEPGPYEVVLVRLPRAKESFELALAAAADVLAEGGRLLVGGANDEGIKSAKARIEARFEDVRVATTRQHGRVWRARRGVATADEAPASVEASREVVPHPLGVEGAAWVCYPGVFAKGKLDPATALLCEALPALEPHAEILDFAAGAGVIAAAALRAQPQARLTLLEADAIALHAAQQNVPQARRLLCSDGWHALDAHARFDHILSNPPIHRGKAEDFTLVADLIARAPDHLRPDGTLTLVIQRQVALAPLLEAAFAHVEIAAQDTRFRVWRATAPHPRHAP